MELSLFERLVHAGVKPHLLETQYRMHPAISEFPRHHFYAGRLQDGIAGKSRPPAPGFAWPDPSQPVCLVVHSGAEQKDGDSFYNEAEVQKALETVNAFLGAGVRMDELGVVTPYAAQARMSRRALVLTVTL